MENFQEYSTAQYELVGHCLVIGFAAQLAGFIYFYMTIYMTAKKYRLSSVYGMIVMASAFILLYNQWNAWETSFAYNPVLDKYVSTGDKLFSNGYRYLNWSIDVPLLLLQLALVSGIDIGEGIANKNVMITSSGLLMIYLGYVGQFFEDKDEPAVLLAMGGLGIACYGVMLWLVFLCLKSAKETLPESCGFKITLVMVIFLVFWTIYPISYYMPIISYSAWGVVIRQFIYTVADVVSKVIYGVILTQITMEVDAIEKAEGNGMNEHTKNAMTSDNIVV